MTTAANGTRIEAANTPPIPAGIKARRNSSGNEPGINASKIAPTNAPVTPPKNKLGPNRPPAAPLPTVVLVAQHLTSTTAASTPLQCHHDRSAWPANSEPSRACCTKW